ncbi:MAG: hypothetical protein QF719_02160 [Chloroflexota bacterium]|nr:hypothetical protein [Chloroflexota bacterium]MDP6757008.1 hypothetical protein [Chloroflexota bacterium]
MIPAPVLTPMLDPETGDPILDPTSGLPIYPTLTPTATATPTRVFTRTPHPARTPTPGVVANLPLDGSSTNVALADNLAYLSAKGAGLHVVDVGDIDNPVLITTIPGSPDDVVVEGDLLLVLHVGDDIPLRAYDMSEPAEPRELLVPPGIRCETFGGVAVENGLAVVSGGDAPMTVLDVSSPEDIQIAATFAKEIGFAKVTLDEGLAFLSGEVGGDPRYGILVYDLANPADPRLVQYLRVPGLGRLSRVRAPGNYDLEVEVAGSLLLVAGGGRLSAISILPLSQADLVVSLLASEDAVHVAWDGRLVVVSGVDLTLYDASVQPRVVRLQ